MANSDPDRDKNNPNEGLLGLTAAMSERFIVQLRNSIGVTVEAKSLPIGFVPKVICMGPNNFVACSDRTVYSWRISTSQGGNTSTVSKRE